MQGERKEGELVADACIEYYKQLLGTARESTSCISNEIIAQGPCLNADQQDAMMRPVTDTEIQATLFSIPEEKSPGPDGFRTAFYKKILGGHWAICYSCN